MASSIAPQQRAILFIDGNNWYHGLKSIGVARSGDLSYRKIAEKLLGPRVWVGTRYYIGRLGQDGDPGMYADQRRFLGRLERSDRRISVHLGRIECRPAKNDLAKELRSYLAETRTRIDPGVYKDLQGMASKHAEARVWVEKAVDVMLAVDLVDLAQQDAYDAAYILSADGDYTHAVEMVSQKGKTVFAASALSGAQLARVVKSFIRLKRDWFTDCYL